MKKPKNLGSHKRKAFIKALKIYRSKRKKTANGDKGLKKRIDRLQKKSFKPISAPLNFSLIGNPVGVINYLHKIQKSLKSGQNTVIDMSMVDSMTSDAIPFLISHVKEFGKRYKASVGGISPDKPALRNLIRRAGFYDHVRSNVPFKDRFSSSILLDKITNNKVENELAKKACIKGISHTFKDKRIFSPLYEIIIECMANTNNHASLSGPGEYKWWIYVYQFPNTAKTAYAFIDLGVGVFSSLSTRTIWQYIFQELNITDNVQLLKLMFQGVTKSRTNLLERGKGMPLIYEHSARPEFSTFVFISNNVYYDLKNQTHKYLEKEFSGTFYYWELENNTDDQN